MRKFFRHFDLILTILISGAAVVALFSPFVDPAKNWLYAFFALLFPLFLILNLLLFFYWGIRLLLGRKKHRLAILLPLIVLIFGWMSPARIFQYHSFAQAASTQTSVRLMTYNVQSLYSIRKQKLEKPFKLFLNKEHPDIVMAQECSNSSAKKIASLLGYKHYTINKTKKALGTAVISKYPILKYEQKPFFKSGNSYTWADVKVKGKTIRFFSLHLQSNAISTVASQLKENADLKDKRTWSKFRKILALYRMTAKQRTNQSRQVKQLAALSPHPVFFCGDFNDPPLSNSYHILSENKTDSFRERGKGLGTTYDGLTPAMRIDYILAPTNFKVLNHRVPNVNFSDHFPVLVDVAWMD